MAPASRVNLDDIFSKAIERSKHLRGDAAKLAVRANVLSAYRSNVPSRPPLAPERRPVAAHVQGRQPTWKRAKQCALWADARRVKGLDSAINEARQDIVDARASAVRAPECLAIGIQTHAADAVGEAIACVGWSPKEELLMLPDSWGSEADGPPKQPPQSRYTPRRIASVLRSSVSQTPSRLAGAPSQDVLPSFSRWKHKSKHDKNEDAILATVRELEVLGKLLAERSPVLKRRRAPDVGVVRGQSRPVFLAERSPAVKRRRAPSRYV